VNQLPEEYTIFYINLRAKFLSSYESFIEALFGLEETRRKETLKELVFSATKVAGIPITEKFLDNVFNKITVDAGFARNVGSNWQDGEMSTKTFK
jgi:AAA+ ATPase superfamily predicted ATPase